MFTTASVGAGVDSARRPLPKEKARQSGPSMELGGLEPPTS